MLRRKRRGRRVACSKQQKKKKSERDACASKLESPPQSAGAPRPGGPSAPLRSDQTSCLGSPKEGSVSAAGLVFRLYFLFAEEARKKKKKTPPPTFTFCLVFLPLLCSPPAGNSLVCSVALSLTIRVIGQMESGLESRC